LTDRQRAVLTAVVLDGEPPARLAAELNMTTGAVYKALHDARIKLRAGVERERSSSADESEVAP
jgi:DNA-directed RNA polymerase specialized sigma24 family protein